MAPPLLCLLGCLPGRVAPVHERAPVAGQVTNDRFKIQSTTNFQKSKLKASTRTVQIKKVEQSKKQNKTSLEEHEWEIRVLTKARSKGLFVSSASFQWDCFFGLVVFGVLYSLLPQPLSICFVLSSSTTRKRSSARKVLHLSFSRSGCLRHIYSHSPVSLAVPLLILSRAGNTQ